MREKADSFGSATDALYGVGWRLSKRIDIPIYKEINTAMQVYGNLQTCGVSNPYQQGDHCCWFRWRLEMLSRWCWYMCLKIYLCDFFLQLIVVNLMCSRSSSWHYLLWSGMHLRTHQDAYEYTNRYNGHLSMITQHQPIKHDWTVFAYLHRMILVAHARSFDIPNNACHRSELNTWHAHAWNWTESNASEGVS